MGLLAISSENSLSVFLQLTQKEVKSTSNNPWKYKEKGRESYLVPKMRKVKRSFENSVSVPASVPGQSSSSSGSGPFLSLFSLPGPTFLHPENAITSYGFLWVVLWWFSVTQNVPPARVHGCGQGLPVGTPASSEEKQAEAFKPMGCLSATFDSRRPLRSAVLCSSV